MDLCDLDEWLCLSPDRELQSRGPVLVMACLELWALPAPDRCWANIC